MTASPPASLASVGLALLAAITWGGGDFAGGMGVKRAGGSTHGALRVVISAHAMSLLVLLGVLGWQQAALPHGLPLICGLAAGVAGGLSLTAFYVALARGAMGASAAVSGLLAAAIPAFVALWTEGAPGSVRVLGFALAAGAIWLIAAGPVDPGSQTPAETRTITMLAIGGGIGFGFYFVFLHFADSLGVVEPMTLARMGSLCTCLLLLVFFRSKPQDHSPKSTAWLSRSAWLWAGGVALLDTGGNLLFVAASRTGRLDVPAVLASLYPASTILLAAALLKERPSTRQFLGMGLAVAAVVLITV
ncbi:MAG: EamA family transporter [Janthinobacterium lividum]